MNDDILETLRNLCNETAPGPWYIEGNKEDAEFIAAARTYMPLLLDVVEAAQELRFEHGWGEPKHETWVRFLKALKKLEET